MIVIIDYGMGNLGSVINMLKKVGHKSKASSDIDEINSASKIILPGVGSFDKAMQNLQALNLVQLLKDKALVEKIPFLGICLGMQLLTKGSEEGKEQGLGFIDASAEKFIFDKEQNLPIPHMGWNVAKVNKESKLFKITEEQRFYFVHSYAIQCNDTKDILTTTKYGKEFVSSFERNNIIGAQFHPEKSHKFGTAFLKNFVEDY